MKRLWVLFVFALISYELAGQQLATYNKKGDDALARTDYSDAKMWFEEGVVNCDLYSIDKITQIWRTQTEMRGTMRSLMNKCFNCLTTKSVANDTTAIKILILYHKEGIGVVQNKNLATYWSQRLTFLTKGTNPSNTNEQQTFREEKQSNFFIGYNYSIETPFGITFGTIGRKLGWYARIKSNLSFATSDGENNNQSLIPQIENPYLFDKEKINAHAGSAGVIYKYTDQFQASIGVGYGVRNLLWHYITYKDDEKSGEGWSKNVEASYNGVLAEVDLIWRFGNMFISGGCYTVNFKYVDLNAGIGVYF
ncbi:MAG: hypothetical protein PHG27_10805 [Massilibacteroides sp.]|nr:hypothetical protein [Massilibacteroides sp.]